MITFVLAADHADRLLHFWHNWGNRLCYINKELVDMLLAIGLQKVEVWLGRSLVCSFIHVG